MIEFLKIYGAKRAMLKKVIQGSGLTVTFATNTTISDLTISKCAVYLI